jgi:hypothetical protein
LTYKKFKKLTVSLTIVTVPILFLTGINFIYFTFIKPVTSHPGDPNIGHGLLILAIIINIPIFVLWVIIFRANRKNDSNTSNL